MFIPACTPHVLEARDLFTLHTCICPTMDYARPIMIA